MLLHRFRLTCLSLSLAWLIVVCVSCTQQGQDPKSPPLTYPPTWLGNHKNFTDANSACQSLADFRGAKLVNVELKYRYGQKEKGVLGAWCDMEGTAIDGEMTFVGCPYVGGIGFYAYVGGVKGICVLPAALKEYQNKLERGKNLRNIAIATGILAGVVLAKKFWPVAGIAMAGRVIRGILRTASATASATARRAFRGRLGRKLGQSQKAYDLAKQGGKHSGFYRNYLNKSNSEIRNGIDSFKRRIAEHQDKIKNPEKHIHNFKNLDPRQQKALIDKKWPGDIARQQEQKSILEEMLRERNK